MTTKQRAWAWHRQGLDGSQLGAAAATVIANTGWLRSVGGANPYLSLFARAGLRREQVDAEVARLAVHELPVVRGCTYVVSAEDFSWALQLGREAAEVPVRVLTKLGVSRTEIDELLTAVVEQLQPGEKLDPQQLKQVLGAAVRSLGEEGKKKGASTTLPAALGILQSEGRIRRVPLNGRLDQQRYAYQYWGLAQSGLSDQQARSKIIAKYLHWTGGATIKQSQWFTAFTVAQIKTALLELKAEESGGLWMLPGDRESYESFKVPDQQQIQLLAGSDGLALLRRNAPDLLAEQDRGKSLLGEKSLALVADLPDHPIVDRGQIVGLWQYDPGRAEIVPWIFGQATTAIKQRIAQVQDYIRQDLTDFRSFSLDSPASRQKRIDALRAAQSG
ncbi:DNA glycosylase AlkZ-like family protein [Psychromicrobium lacuslunae]|uniref:Winged helix DNA-binding domain-containing protein n=1 Tax=Psychromicrobium lacuslunae TaxID=1618207 RepID=A0A0D4C177_9MICC|nr:crosslink repair DNA glycosylase YcaQ family protein [Psychromicrobium lacuslunae]AJT42145.1 hypothetical protein UM93_12665 [Psychromicrobium lacuslunae]